MQNLSVQGERKVLMTIGMDYIQINELQSMTAMHSQCKLFIALYKGLSVYFGTAFA